LLIYGRPAEGRGEEDEQTGMNERFKDSKREAGKSCLLLTTRKMRMKLFEGVFLILRVDSGRVAAKGET